MDKEDLSESGVALLSIILFTGFLILCVAVPVIGIIICSILGLGLICFLACILSGGTQER
ncbi:hypothetical protein LCGC14_0479790 [marine sediment metagenome]|uniref:Uncharacterized protein n=1 Tax=marine sediment metagenome TaxID=412755 RepID=A0A0F9VIJ2_9ZZZZ